MAIDEKVDPGAEELVGRLVAAVRRFAAEHPDHTIMSTSTGSEVAYVISIICSTCFDKAINDADETKEALTWKEN